MDYGVPGKIAYGQSLHENQKELDLQKIFIFGGGRFFGYERLALKENPLNLHLQFLPGNPGKPNQSSLLPKLRSM